MDSLENNSSGRPYDLPSCLISVYPGGRAVYITSLALIVIGLACLPFIRVQVAISGRGIIRPTLERTSIVSASTGIISRVFVCEGDRVRRNQPVLQIRSRETQFMLNLLTEELNETLSHAEDIKNLCSNPVVPPQTVKFRRIYEEFLDQLEYLELRHKREKTELERHKGLYSGGLISTKEYEDLIFSENRSKKEVEVYRSRTFAEWQLEQNRHIERIRELESGINKAREKIRLTTIYAPETGNLVEFSGILEGSVIEAGSVIGILSPDSDLIGEFYIPSRNMAFLRTGQEVQLHLDAFNAREWGVVRGSVTDISNDFLLMNEQPVYRVKCKLDGTEMRLRNGYSAQLRKGMTFNARCMVAKRTLFQLLTDKVSNWLMPGRNAGEVTLLHIN